MDFGASRIKALLYCLDTQRILSKAEVISPSTENHAKYPAYQIPLRLYRNAFEELVRLIDIKQQADKIFTCFEMHGFSLDDYYYSWKDARADLSWSYQFYNETKMRLKPGMAFSTIKALNIKNKKIGTLANAILDEIEGNHISLVASQGLVQYSSADLSDKILHYLNCETYPIVDSYLGASTIDKKRYQIYGGLGDLQAALIGSDLGNAADLVLNLGTGSQVAMLMSNGEGDLRPIDKSSWAKVITHIPAGRALNVLAELLEPSRFWNIWNQLTIDDLLEQNPIQVDLKIFEGSWGYISPDKSGLVYLKESQTIKQFISAIACSWLNQYCLAIETIDKDCITKNVILSGGLADKSHFALDYLGHKDRTRKYSLMKTLTGETTLDGLIKFAKNNIK